MHFLYPLRDGVLDDASRLFGAVEPATVKEAGVRSYYQDDFVTIFHGDSRDIMAGLSLAGRGGIVATDPPYNVGYHYKSYSDDLSADEYQELIRLTCPLPTVIIHYAEHLCAISWTLEELPEKIVAWVYPSNTPRQWRGIGWWGCKPDFTKDSQPYRNQSDQRIKERMERGHRARLYDWWEINQVKNVSKEKTDHPCQIPVELMTRILKITPCETVIDPFLGSGTTLRAAKNLGIRAVGIDVDEEYCELAAKRMSQGVLLTH